MLQDPPDGPNTAQDGPKTPQETPKTTHDRQTIDKGGRVTVWGKGKGKPFPEGEDGAME